MRVWLDDVRPSPPGWEWVKSSSEVIRLLQEGDVTEMSLDHDLGFPIEDTGYMVLAWLERQLVDEQWEHRLPIIHVHTRNPVGWVKMTATRERIRAHGSSDA